MKLKVTTENSSYLLDKEAMTWERTLVGGGSGVLRSAGGELVAWPSPVVGKPMNLFGPALSPGANVRLVSTSHVVKVEEVK